MYSSACHPSLSYSASFGYHCPILYLIPSGLSLPLRRVNFGTWHSNSVLKITVDLGKILLSSITSRIVSYCFVCCCFPFTEIFKTAQYPCSSGVKSMIRFLNLVSKSVTSSPFMVLPNTRVSELRLTTSIILLGLNAFQNKWMNILFNESGELLV